MVLARRMARWSFALLVATSLGLGAGEALAAPEAGPALRACDFYTCYTACRNKGYFTGKCTSDGICVCTPRP